MIRVCRKYGEATNVAHFVWFESLVLKHCSKSRTRLPSTLFGALSSLSITSNVLCNILRYCNKIKRVN